MVVFGVVIQKPSQFPQVQFHVVDSKATRAATFSSVQSKAVARASTMSLAARGLDLATPVFGLLHSQDRWRGLRADGTRPTVAFCQ